MDTYVELANPEANNGAKKDLKVGKFVNATETYLYFEFDDDSTSYDEVDISLNIHNVTERMEIEVYLITDDWNEMTMNWTNKPKKSFLIDRFDITIEAEYSISVTDEVDYLIDKYKDGISICIHHSDNETSDGSFQAISSEGYVEEDEAPLLIYKYEISADIVSKNKFTREFSKIECFADIFFS